jgi:hypothetical protein
MYELNRGILEEVKWEIKRIVCKSVDWLGPSGAFV